jgi:hypothetical protein
MTSAQGSVFVLIAVLASCKPSLPMPDPLAPGPVAAGVEGIVSSVERPRPEDSQAYVHVVITPREQQPIKLVLAPGWYLDRQGIRFGPHESVRAEGRRVLEDGEPRIVVRRLHQGSRSYVLRDDNEQPAWLKP